MSEVDLNEGLFAVIEEGLGWRIESRNIPRLRTLLGDPLVVGFARAFAGAERLDALHHVLHLVNQDGGEARAGTAFTRNFWTIIAMTWGTMREFVDALKKLRRAGVEARLSDKTAWERLETARKRWSDHPTPIAVRNQLAFHLGDPALYQDALRGWPSEAPLVFVSGDFSGSRSYAKDARHPFALDLLFRGLGVGDKELRAFAEEAGHEHLDASRNLQLVFADVLRGAGVDLLPIGAEDEEEDG